MSSTPNTASSSMGALNSGKPLPGLKLAADAVASVPRQRGRGLSPRIESKLRSALIDLSCVPGPDLKVFAERSRTALPSEGSARFAIMAHVGSGCQGCSRDSSSSIRFFAVV